MPASTNQVAAYAATIMGFIDEAISEGAVPATVRSFTQVHSYLDANDFLEHAGVPYDGSDASVAVIAAVEEEVSRRLAASTRPYCTFGRCAYRLHDHSTLTGPDGEPLWRPDALRCFDCGHTAHYDGKLYRLRHDDPALDAQGCPSMATAGRATDPADTTDPAGVEAVSASGEGLHAETGWVDGWVAAAHDPGCYTFGPYRAQIRLGGRWPDGSVPARFDLQALSGIAEDQRYAPAGSSIGEPIDVFHGQVSRIGPPGETLPSADGWWHLDTPPWRWVPCDLSPDHPVWQPLFDTVPSPDGSRRRCAVCGSVEQIDTTTTPSRFGDAAEDTIHRCRCCGSAQVAYAEVPARSERAPWPAPGPLPTSADRTEWDGREGIPGGWWRLPHDARLRIRPEGTGLDRLLVSTQLHASFTPPGPAYVDVRELTAWDTNHDVPSPARQAYQTLTEQFPGRFTTVVDVAHPGTVYLAIRLLTLTDEITDTILNQHRRHRTAPDGDDSRPGGQNEPEHDCQAAGTLEYEAEYGAPGIGQAWKCTTCGRGWARLGDTFWPAEAGAHILAPQDVE